jgi:hypothetical protein
MFAVNRNIEAVFACGGQLHLLQVDDIDRGGVPEVGFARKLPEAQKIGQSESS